MAYKLRDQRSGYHHVVSRGNNKQLVYLDDSDRRSFFVILDWVCRKYRWKVIAHALMRNHYHLVLRIEEPELARGMCDLNGTYALYFNGRHGRINHVFGRRYWNEFVKTDAHLKNAIRYVIQNPRRAGVPGPLESHAWTSYAASIGDAFGIASFARDELLELFGPTPALAVPAFIDFCEQPAPPRQDESGLVRRQPPVPKLRVRVT